MCGPLCSWCMRTSLVCMCKAAREFSEQQNAMQAPGLQINRDTDSSCESGTKTWSCVICEVVVNELRTKLVMFWQARYRFLIGENLV